MINNNLESIKQDYLDLIDKINRSLEDKDIIKVDESMAINLTNLKAYRDSIGLFLNNNLNKTKDMKHQLDNANKKLEVKQEKYDKIKNENNETGMIMTKTLDERESLEYNFNLQFNIFIGLVILLCILYFVINRNLSFIILVVGIFLLFGYYYYKK